ncbi:MAG: hypothetical protein KA763_00595 [Xanthomonadales bacterium]|nr:hypothetical protein [Xanthomonadales bacterium]
MAVRINQYEQRTAVSGGAPVPRARGAQLDQSLTDAGQRFAGAIAGAAQTFDQVQQAKERAAAAEEAENAKIWTANALANASMWSAEKMAEMQSSAGEGAPNFTRDFADQFSEYEQTALSVAPNDTAKKFLTERMLALRTDMGGRALEFETNERRRWRVNTTAKTADAVAATVAQDPSRIAVQLAEQHAVIDSLDVPPEQRRALREDFDQKVATAAVLGEVKRDPAMAQAKLAARLGVSVKEIDTPRMAPINTDAKTVQEKYAAIGAAFRFVTTSTTRSKAENDRADGVKNSQHLEGRGTARDWSVKGKSPAEIDAFAAALRAEGFEVITANHGTGPHVHAELPPKSAKPRRTVEQAVAEKPEGERVGDVAYDLLTVPQVVQLLGTVSGELDKQKSQFRSLIASREADDLAAYGDGKQPPNPVTGREFVDAFGGIEGPQRYARHKSAAQYASARTGFSTKSNAEIQATLAAMEPQPGEGYAAKAQQYATMLQAAQATVAARNDDPVAFAMSAGTTTARPLNFQDQDAMASGLRERVGVAEMNSRKFGTRYTLLTKGESAQMAATMQAMTAPEKAQFLQSVRGALPDPAAYQSIMSQIRPDSPVTATAGSIMVVGGSVKVGSGGLFSDAPRVTAEQVSQRVLMGEDLLNPTKGDKAADGKPKFPMPKETDLRGAWTAYVGKAYAGAPGTEADTYQAFRAYYAAELAQAGDYSGQFSEDAAERAARAVTGGVTEYNGSQIVLPWGMPADYVLDALRAGWAERVAADGIGSVPFEAIDLQTVGDGVYAVNAGTGPVRGKDGMPIYLRVPRSKPIPAAPASSYGTIPGGQAPK